MPRPFDHELRSHFEATDVPRKSRCRHCASEILNHAGSLKRHLNEFCKAYSNSSSSIGGGVGSDVDAYNNNHNNHNNNNNNGASSSSRASRRSTAAEASRYSAGGYGYVPGNLSSASGGGGGPNDPNLLLPPGMDIDGPAGEGVGPHQHQHQQQNHHQSPRKAQQQARKQNTARARILEQQVMGLQGEVQRLRRENEILRGRQAHVQHVVSSWTDFTGPAMFGSFAGSGGGGGGGGGIETGRTTAAARVPAWRGEGGGGGGGGGPSDHRPPTGNADAPGDTDGAGDGGEDGGGATGSRNSPLFTP